MIKINIEFTDEYQRKMNINWEDILSQLNEKAIENIYNYIITPGDGVKNGNQPSGGAPVDTGNLINNHYIKNNSKLEHTIENNTEYVQYVINGTSKMAPNDYPERAKEDFLSNELEGLIKEKIEGLNLK